MVEFVAESLLKCTNETITTPPPEEPAAPLPSLTGLIGWWDASVHSSLGLSGSTINTVADQSGNGNDLAAFGANPKPTYSATGFNSRPAMIFTAASDSALARSSFPMGIGNTLTFWWVATRTSDVFFENQGRSLSYTASGATHDYNNAASWAGTFGLFTESMRLERKNLRTPPGGFVDVNIPTRFIGTINSSGVMTIYTDGVASATTTATGNWTTGGVLVVGSGKLDPESWDGAVAEFGICTGFHDSTVIAQLDAYLADKWGL